MNEANLISPLVAPPPTISSVSGISPRRRTARPHVRPFRFQFARPRPVSARQPFKGPNLNFPGHKAKLACFLGVLLAAPGHASCLLGSFMPGIALVLSVHV